MLKLTPLILLLFLTIEVRLFESLQTDKLQANEPLEIIVTVTDKRGNLIQGLKQENFQVFIDKIRQKIERVSQADEPISIGIVVDASGSIQEIARIQDLAKSISRFQALSNEQNEYFLIAFNDTPELLADWTANLDSGLANLITVKPRLHTAFYDACYVAAEKVNSGRHRKRALIVISDGMDNQSRYGFKEVKEYLRETEVILNVIGLSTDDGAGGALGKESRDLLEELSKLSGGVSIFRRDRGSWQSSELNKAAEMIAHRLRYQYRIRLTPIYKATEKWHQLKISFNVPHPPKELQGLSARAREGFYLPLTKQTK